MGVYRIGEIIRRKRKALGLSREKLCELSQEVCSPMTLYRIEHGKVKVKQEIYNKLMQCMNQLPERCYGTIGVLDNQCLILKDEIYKHLVYLEYAKAEEKLALLQTMIDMDYPRNRQFVISMQAILDYRQKRIDAQQYLKKLKEAICYTMPEFERIDFALWPANQEEFQIILHMLAGYEAQKMSSAYYELAEKQLDSLCWETIDTLNRSYCKMELVRRLSGFYYQNKEEPQKTQKICEDMICTAITSRYLGLMNDVIYLSFYCDTMLHSKQISVMDEKKFAEAYYMAVAHDDKQSLEFYQSVLPFINTIKIV